MNEEHIRRRFSEKIRQNYEGLLKGWLSQEPKELVVCAEEIAAAKMLANTLPKITSIADMEYLLRFENPLEVVQDGWMFYDGADRSGEIRHALGTIVMDTSLQEVYALSEEQRPLPKGPATVREILERYPNDSFDMMTPGGFVYLTPEKAQALLAGESVMGNPGCSGFDMEVAAVELLSQRIRDVRYEDGTWRFLSYWEQEMQDGPPTMEQGVTMC